MVGIELGTAGDIAGLLARMEESKIHCQQLQPGTPEYDFLVA